MSKLVIIIIAPPLFFLFLFSYLADIIPCHVLFFVVVVVPSDIE